MPYFCFSLKNRIDIKIYSNLINENLDNLELNKKYFSKNTNLYKILNKKCFKGSINFVRFIKRDKLFKLRSDILICLPPNIGLGDAVEYALSIKAIENHNLQELKTLKEFTTKYDWKYLAPVYDDRMKSIL